MKTKRVNRYYCDYCKKSGCNRWHIEQHEKHCTANPNRICRMCDELEVNQRPIAQLTALLPDIPPGEIDWEEIDVMMADALQKLRDAANGCPACMLAAIRQKGIAEIAGFDYKRESQEIWQECRE